MILYIYYLIVQYKNANCSLNVFLVKAYLKIERVNWWKATFPNVIQFSVCFGGKNPKFRNAKAQCYFIELVIFPSTFKFWCIHRNWCAVLRNYFQNNNLCNLLFEFVLKFVFRWLFNLHIIYWFYYKIMMTATTIPYQQNGYKLCTKHISGFSLQFSL